MSFELEHMAEVLGAWYLAYADKDWLCMVWRETPLSGWTIRYRVRYYDAREADAYSGLDRKRWYASQAPVDRLRAAVLADMRRLVAALRAQWPQPTTYVDEVLVEGDGWALVEALRGRPWVHEKVGEEALEWERQYQARLLPAPRRRATRLKGRRRRR